MRSGEFKNPLSTRQLACIMRDSRGFLWFCTNEGLSRFDGYTFTNFGTNEGLPHPIVMNLIETRAGDYWVAARLLELLKEVVDGGAPMSPEVARRVVGLFRDFRPPETASYRLTSQETQLLKLIEGHYKKTAAREMNISVNTVSFHLKNIYEKLQVHSKTEAVAKALREHLV